MTDPLTPPAPPPVPNESKGKNCWIVGCSGCLIVVLVIFLGSVFAVNWAKNNFMTEPFEPLDLLPEEEARIEAKFEGLQMLNDQGGVREDFELPAGGLILTETEVNYMISNSNDDMADALRIDFEPGEVMAELRILFEEGGDHFRMSAGVSIEHVDGVLDVRLTNIGMGPFDMPAEILEDADSENLAEDFFEDDQAREAFQESIERIEVQKDQILIVPKAR